MHTSPTNGQRRQHPTGATLAGLKTALADIGDTYKRLKILPPETMSWMEYYKRFHSDVSRTRLPDVSDIHRDFDIANSVAFVLEPTDLFTEDYRCLIAPTRHTGDPAHGCKRIYDTIRRKRPEAPSSDDELQGYKRAEGGGGLMGLLRGSSEVDKEMAAPSSVSQVTGLAMGKLAKGTPKDFLVWLQKMLDWASVVEDGDLLSLLLLSHRVMYTWIKTICNTPIYHMDSLLRAPDTTHIEKFIQSNTERDASGDRAALQRDAQEGLRGTRFDKEETRRRIVTACMRVAYNITAAVVTTALTDGFTCNNLVTQEGTLAVTIFDCVIDGYNAKITVVN